MGEASFDEVNLYVDQKGNLKDQMGPVLNGAMKLSKLATFGIQNPNAAIPTEGGNQTIRLSTITSVSIRFNDPSQSDFGKSVLRSMGVQADVTNEGKIAIQTTGGGAQGMMAIPVQQGTKAAAQAFVDALRQAVAQAAAPQNTIIYQTAPAPAGDTKVCPDCAEEVKVAANKCRYCGYRFLDSDSDAGSAIAPITEPQNVQGSADTSSISPSTAPAKEDSPLSQPPLPVVIPEPIPAQPEQPEPQASVTNATQDSEKQEAEEPVRVSVISSTPVTTEAPYSNDDEKPKSKISIIAFALIAVAAIVGGLLLASNLRNQDQTASSAQTNVPAPQSSSTLTSGTQVTSAELINILLKAGACLTADKPGNPDAANPAADLAVGTDLTCYNYVDIDPASPAMDCPALYYVRTSASTDPAANLKGRMEGTGAVAIESGLGWQIALVKTYTDSTVDPVAACTREINTLHKVMAGHLEVLQTGLAGGHD
jgi:ribosomal protein L40E